MPAGTADLLGSALSVGRPHGGAEPEWGGAGRPADDPPHGLHASHCRAVDSTVIRAHHQAAGAYQQEPCAAQRPDAGTVHRAGTRGRDHPVHPARTMPILRQPDAHRRDIPLRPETDVARTTTGAGRMTNRPSLSQKPLWIGYPSPMAPGLPRVASGPRAADQMRRTRPNIITSADQDALEGRRFPSSRQSRSTVAGNLSSLSP